VFPVGAGLQELANLICRIDVEPCHSPCHIPVGGVDSAGIGIVVATSRAVVLDHAASLVDVLGIGLVIGENGLRVGCELMPKKIREIKAILRKEGFDWRPAKGSHTRWTHPLLPEDPITLCRGDGDDVPPYLQGQVDRVLRKLKRLKGEQ